jgi:hypothetical protein
VFLVIYYSYQEANGLNVRYAKSVQITELEICEISYAGNVPRSITVCGYLETSDIARLRIGLFKMPKEIYIAENPPKDLFDRGYFKRVLFLPNDIEYGEYLVKIVLNREVVGEISFHIAQPEQ